MPIVQEPPSIEPSTDTAPPTEVDVVIVGAGFSGLGMAIRLKQAGMDDFVILERAGAVGGTWYHNTYPGCACDVPSHLYSFSFAPNPEWSETYSPQPQIHAYLEGCADRFGIRPHLRLHHDVLDAAWNDDEQRWLIETSKGPFSARVVVAGMGPLNEPKFPDVPGLDSFEGETMHSSTTTSTASAWHRWAPAPRPSSTCRTSSRRSSACTSSSAPPRGCCRTATAT
jgi:cation diffusion facilitator CzcD-associated flavoprotein CzcO